METKKEIEKMIDELCQLDQAIQDGRKIEKTSLCKEAAEVLKAIFHIQDQEHKTIIRDESKIKTNEVEKKRSGKWIKTMKPLKKFYEKYGERVYVTGFGVGPRIVKAIKMYINNLPKTEINGFNKGVALDYQIAQRILTKVRGPEIQIGRLLNGKSNTGFNQIFDKYSELSDFKKCRKVISEKQKELGAYGYCI